VSARFGEFAFAIQSAYGTPASAPLWAMPLGMPEGSGVPVPEVEWDPHPAARGSVGLQEVRRTMVSWLSDISVPAFTQPTAVLLKGLLGGETVTGTFRSLVPATPDLWFTFWSKRPGQNYERWTDGLIEGLRFDFTSGEPVNLGVQARGREPEFLASSYTPTNQADIRLGWLTYIGTEVKFDWSSNPPTVSRWETESGQLFISRPANVIPSYRNVKPTAVTRGNLSVELPLQLVFRDIEHYRQSVYGGLVTVPQRATVYGSATLKFYEPDQAGGRYLYVNLPAVSWDVAAPQPLAHPEEGSVLVDLVGKAVVPVVIGRTGPMIQIDIETGVVGATTKVVSDSAAGADTSSLITPTAKNVSDSGVAADTRNLTATVAVSDTAAGADSSSLLAAGVVNVTDSGVGSDASGTGKPVSDSAVGSETTDMGKQVGDSATAFETTGLTTPVAVSDAGSAAETSAVVTARAVTDTAVGADTSALAAAVTVSDAGSGADSSGLTIPGVGGQLHFRIRSDDSQTLNADAGWAASLDQNATIPAERIFRIRFELVDVGTVTPKLQYRRNGGAWTDVPNRAVAEPSQTGTDECEAVLSGAFSNGDATTNVLAGSAAAFVAGDGVEGPAAPSSAATASAHTEYEWAVRMRKLWHNGTTRGGNVHNDTFEFRVVPTAGGLLSGSYVNPTVTLDCSYRIGGVIIESIHRGGPFRDTNGNMYTPVEYGEPSNISDEIVMMKSTDGGVQWDRVDDAGAPNKANDGAYDFEAGDIQQIGPTLHFAHYSKNPRYSTFRTSDHPTDPDTWDIKSEVVKNNTVQPTDQEASIAVRSDGSIVYFYRKEPSGGFEQLAYKVRSTGGTWGSETLLDSTASISWFGATCVVGASDLIHIFYEDNTNNLLYYRTLSSSNVLGTRSQFNATGTSPTAKPVNAARYFDDAGVETVVATYRRSSNLWERRIIGGVFQAERQISGVSIANNRAGSNQPTTHLSVDPASKTIYAVYVDSINFDLFYDKSVAGGAYGTDVAVQTGDFYEISSEYSNGVFHIVVDDQAAGYSGGVIYIPILVGGAVSVSVSDTLSASDSSSVVGPVAKNVSDSGAGSDASVLTAALPRSDSGSAGEASSVLGPTNKDVSDSASGSDASSPTTAILTANDSMVGTDSSGVSTGVLPTLALIDSFQHRVIPGNITATASFWYSNATNVGTLPNHGGGNLTFDTGIKRTASHVCSLKVVADNVTPTAFRRTIAQQKVNGSIYFRVDSAPTSGVNIVSCDPPVSSVLRVQILPDGHIQTKVAGGTVQQSSGTYIDSAWHRLDWKFDTSTTTGTADAIVDGTDTLPQATGTITAGNMTARHVGDKNASGPGTFYASDDVVSFTETDYPIGVHTCKLLAINGSGTHAQGSGAFQTMPGAGTTSYDTFVDDAWDGTTPELSQTGEDYVRQTVIDGAGYLEFTVADPAGGDTAIWGAQLGVLMASEDSATADNCECRLVDSAGSTLATTGLIDPSINAAYYSGYRIIASSAPSGGWSNSSLAGVKIRFGFSTDVTPNPTMNAAIVEYVVGA
jgi:hypothetical protein